MSKRKNTETKAPAPAAPAPATPDQLTRGNLLVLYTVLGTAKGIYKTTLARVTALSIRKRLEATCEPLVEARNAAVTVPKEFTEARLAACRELAEKGADGGPLIMNGQFVLSAGNQVEVEKRVAALRVEHKAALDAYEAGVAEFNEFVAEKVGMPPEVGSMRLKLSAINDSASMEDLEALMPLIENDVQVA